MKHRRQLRRALRAKTDMTPCDGLSSRERRKSFQRRRSKWSSSKNPHLPWCAPLSERQSPVAKRGAVSGSYGSLPHWDPGFPKAPFGVVLFVGLEGLLQIEDISFSQSAHTLFHYCSFAKSQTICCTQQAAAKSISIPHMKTTHPEKGPLNRPLNHSPFEPSDNRLSSQQDVVVITC